MTARQSDVDVLFPAHVLRDYALLGDGERGAVIGPRGDVVWMCAPQWHDPAVFASLIDGPGAFAVTPLNPRYVWEGHYDDGTLIWNSRWVTTDGIVECREALAMPGDPSTAVLMRCIRVISGNAPVRVVLQPKPGFGRERLDLSKEDDGAWSGSGGGLRLRVSGLGRANLVDGVLREEIRLAPGDEHHLVLELSSKPLPARAPESASLWASTERAWAALAPEMTSSVAPADARRAYAVLRGLTSSSGAMVAAATMGLPEREAAKRNYDYRYAWIRDQCFAGLAAAASGAMDIFDSAVRFVGERLLSDGPSLKPAYTVTGGRVPDEKALDFPGYPGGTDTVGNWINGQFQLDNFGETLLLFATAADHDRLDKVTWTAVELAVAAIEAKWTEPDAGMWELENEYWTHSRLLCVAGLKAIIRHAPTAQAASWESLADKIFDQAAATCMHPSGRWQRSASDERIDSALLLPAIRGAIPPRDPRSLATAAAVRKELFDDGYVYRFSHGPGRLAEAEGAFLLCGFNLALTEHLQGNTVEAFRLFERNRAACGSPGLFTEEFDVEQRQLRGNFPQAFVHAAMLETAHRLAGPPAS
ncbi:glycoside hydrolase family 15 protein [Arthrobacter bambusae]|uniref:glycoside hydrolase family 15 protein n=1 Tax=Arthrobacter bambusae TaxID=1338426 RepID=UPI00277EE2CE|nr:glycoside hydrolase family 15 protein [Arthrobacter bambusae]MDQ0028656.1 GH15 family glucan-1,4-alpha-glucosidase [Arthrobacter bambusae]MDQ0096550.1 GH15 family glucan-1,4-alpha-glucosidase [Arthrobacter bambusae]